MTIKEAANYLQQNGAESLIKYLIQEVEKYQSQLSEFGDNEEQDSIAEQNAEVLRVFYCDDVEDSVTHVSAVLADETLIRVRSDKQQIVILKRG